MRVCASVRAREETMIAWHDRRYSLRLARAIETLTGTYPSVFHEQNEGYRVKLRHSAWLGVDCSALSSEQLNAIELALDNGERADRMDDRMVRRYGR